MNIIEEHIMHYGVKGMHWGVIRYRSAYNRFTQKQRILPKRILANHKRDRAERKEERAAERNVKLEEKKSKIDYKLSTHKQGYRVDDNGNIVPVRSGSATKLIKKQVKIGRKIGRKIGHNKYIQNKAERLIAQMDTDKKLLSIPQGVITTGEGIYSKYAAVRLYGNKMYIGTQRKVERKTRGWERKKLVATAIGNKFTKKRKGK